MNKNLQKMLAVVMLTAFVMSFMFVKAPKAEALSFEDVGNVVTSIPGAVVDGASKITSTVVDGAGKVIGVVVNGIVVTVESVLDQCEKFRLCNIAKDGVESLVSFLVNNPEIASVVAVAIVAGVIIVFPPAVVGGAMVFEGGSGVLGTEAVEMMAGAAEATAEEDGSVSLGTKVVETTAALGDKAKLSVKAVFNKVVSLCEEPDSLNGCRLINKVERDSNLRKKVLQDLLEKQGLTHLTPEEIEKLAVDHILPLACGGTNNISNLQLISAEENAIKGDFAKCTQIPARILLSHGK